MRRPVIRILALALLATLGPAVSAQITPVPVPGTGGTVVVGPKPPLGNPGDVITISPGTSGIDTDGSPTDMVPGFTVTVPLVQCPSCHIGRQTGEDAHRGCSSFLIVLPLVADGVDDPCELEVMLPVMGLPAE